MIAWHLSPTAFASAKVSTKKEFASSGPYIGGSSLRLFLVMDFESGRAEQFAEGMLLDHNWYQ
jgi:hypothetical protein